MSIPENNRPCNHLYAYLETAILSRELKPGDKLPPERSLRTTYNIGRSTVREALRALEQRGLIEIRQGAAGGSFVKAVSTGELRNTLVDLICRGGVTYLQLLEFRQPIELSMVGYAAERATSDDVDMLKGSMRKGVRLAEKGKLDNRELYVWDGNMHLAVARIAKNPLFEWLASTFISENELAHDWALQEKMWRYDPDWLLKVYRDWHEIIQAIERKESMSAQMVMRCHLGWAARALKAIQST